MSNVTAVAAAPSEQALAHFEAEAAVRDGYVDKILWGSDYPHMEGTYQRPHDVDDPSMSLLAMLSLPLLVRAIRASVLGAQGQQRAIAKIDLETAQLHASFGALMVLGLLIAWAQTAFWMTTGH